MSGEKTAKSLLHQLTNSGPSRVRADVPAAVLAPAGRPHRQLETRLHNDLSQSTDGSS